MPTHKGSGVLVAFEGIDGAGKTTQAALLLSVLQKVGEASIGSKEPTNGSWGKRIRDYASSGRHSPREELKYFIRDREQHTKQLIRPALSEGKIVILDRYYYSTIAYQGVRGFSVKPLQQLMRKRFIAPDAVFLLDIHPSLSAYRIQSRGNAPNVFERIADLEQAREIFLSLKDKRIIKIDGSMSIAAVHEKVLESFIDGPLKKRRCAKSYGCDDPFYCAYRITETCPWFTSQAMLRETLAGAVR